MLIFIFFGFHVNCDINLIINCSDVCRVLLGEGQPFAVVAADWDTTGQHVKCPYDEYRGFIPEGHGKCMIFSAKGNFMVVG